MKRISTLFSVLLLTATLSRAQHSVARLWNEKLLHGISTDLARPTVHARNLFHMSIAMYDAWAIYNPSADTYLLGKTVHGFDCPFHRTLPPTDVKAAQEEAISFAAYRLMKHRFAASPGVAELFPQLDALMDSLGYNRNNTSINYKCGPAEMGNYIAHCVIAYGLQDGSNEAHAYANQYYEPVNPPLRIEAPGNMGVTDINRWQPIQFTQFIDQSGNPFSNFTPKFLSPEWGDVLPFSLKPEDATVRERDGHNYTIYHDPGPPALLETTAQDGLADDFKWNHAFVAIWSSLLDPTDGVMLDASPAAVGNNTNYPTNLSTLRDFYDLYEGGDYGTGYTVNPKTGLPYVPQMVPRGDYTRVLAEFWADGPNSETPPGHWFTILNYVNDQPGSSRRVGGVGPLCDNLEWDVKAYFCLGGAMHDAAIAAWGIKGYYDSSRPVAALRAMADLGQSSDPGRANYNPRGLPLVPGLIEIVEPGDPLAGANSQFAGQIKLRAWKGPGYINNPKTDVAGVGWILAKNWWPYQRPTFVTPPFAGYISGHSAYSRAGAEVLTALTGDPYFPGGMGEFHCKKNEFLVFEDGPSVDVTLQWATYRDASDQCSLSRIYGGIHPPMDDMPGRLIGKEIGQEAYDYATQYFRSSTLSDTVFAFKIFPNPTDCVVEINYDFDGSMPIRVFAADGRLALRTELTFFDGQAILDLSNVPGGVYLVEALDENKERRFVEKVLRY